MPSDYDFTLYSHQGGPNGWKARKEHYELYLFQVAIVLSELKLKYRTIFTDFQKGEHKKEDFLKICPNGRIPALVDHQNDDFPVWESGAILLYLVQKYDPEHTIWPIDHKLQTQVTSWIMLQVSGHSVIQGQAFWFKFFHHENVESATRRYIDETRRIYGVLEFHLAEVREEIWDNAEEQDAQPEDLKEAAVWLVGNHCTIADLSYLTWARAAHRLEIDLDSEFPEVSRWVNNMLKRNGVCNGLMPVDSA